MGHEAQGKVAVTITGNALRFQGLRPADRYGASFTLPAGTDPQQLHATITEGPVPDGIGQEVFAILKIENGTLTLAGIDADDARSPRRGADGPSFEGNKMFRYDFRKAPR